MTRILSYNILAGGYNIRAHNTMRIKQLTAIIRSTQPDVVGLVEATNPQVPQRARVIEEMAEALEMELVMGEDMTHCSDYQVALLTRLPVLYKKIHTRPGILTRPLLEVCLEEANGQHLIVFVTHLVATFSEGWAGNALRQREVHEILNIITPQREQGVPHLLMGDFNSLAPGDPFKASALLRYLVHGDQHETNHGMDDGHPHLDYVVPERLRFLNPLLRSIPQSKLLSGLFDFAASLYAPRGTIALLQDAGYVDCYRRVHPQAQGFTCPASVPAGRIDFIFANAVLAQRVQSCSVVTEGEDVPGNHASDHLAVAAEFGESVGVGGRIVQEVDLVQLLDSWNEEDEKEQRDTWEHLKQALDEDRLSDRKLFP